MAFTEPVLTKRIPLDAEQRKLIDYSAYVETGGYKSLRLPGHGPGGHH
ncbi:MAG: hypothetical protein QM754_20655 [Tepidisphaeraceae bacterium]